MNPLIRIFSMTALMISVTTPVRAGDKASCAALAKTAQEVAMDRDGGLSREDEINAAIAQHLTPPTLHIIRIVIDGVYRGYYRDKSPDDTYNQVNQGCLAAGEKE